MLNKPRIKPIAPHTLGKALQFFYQFNRDYKEPHNIFKTFLNHPRLTIKWALFGQHILFTSTLNDRDRELIILRVGWLCQSEYEWAQHVVIGKQSGLSNREIERIKVGLESPEWSEKDIALLNAVEELKNDSFISDKTWLALIRFFDTKQIMDLVFTVGQYNLVSMALNSFGVQLDNDLEGQFQV